MKTMKLRLSIFFILFAGNLYAATPCKGNFPEILEYKVKLFYKFHIDGKPGREVVLLYGGKDTSNR